jgi:hypothetical protein
VGKGKRKGLKIKWSVGEAEKEARKEGRRKGKNGGG